MKRITLFLLIALAISTNVFSQKESTNIQLATVVKTGKVVSKNIQSEKIVKIIDKQAIQQSSAQTIGELLDFVAGIDIRQRGVNDVQADINIRGGSLDQVLILLNGINITDPQTGHSNLDIPIDLNNVDKIEVLSGTAARTLGINAFSGAINIVTNEKNKKSISTNNQFGSFGTLSQQVSANFHCNKWNSFASVSHKSSDGYKANTDYDVTNIFLNIRNNSPWGQNEFQIGDQHKSFGANSFYSLMFPNQYENTKTLVLSYKWSKVFENSKHSFQTYWRRHHDRFELFRKFAGADKFPWYKGHNYHQTDIVGGKWLSSIYWLKHKTTCGIDLRNEHIFSNVLGQKMAQKREVPFESGQFFTKSAERFSLNAFADQTFHFNRWTLSGGIATNYSKQYGTKAFGGVDFKYTFTPATFAFFSTNSAVRIPTYTELYYQSKTHKSNPNLKPETSLTLELGTNTQSENLQLQTSIFYRFGYNIIDYILRPNSDKWESNNLTQINALGGEIIAQYRFQSSFLNSINASYSYLSLDKKANGYDSKYALDYLKHKCVIGLQHRIWKNLSTNWQVLYLVRDGNYTIGKQTKNYQPYTLANTKIMWESRNYDIFANFNNIFNLAYVDYGGLEQPKFNLSIGIRLKLLQE